MFILLAVILSALVAVWIVFPLFLRDTVLEEKEAAILSDAIEKELDELRKQS